MRNSPEYHRDYYQENREAILARTSAYQQTAAGKATQRRAEANYRERHPERVKEIQRASDRSVAGRFSVGKCCAKRCGRVWTLTREQYASIVTDARCYYCEGPLPETGHGLDRIENAKGYEVGNVLPCCGECNQHRSNTWTVDEARAAVQAVLRLRKERQCSNF